MYHDIGKMVKPKLFIENQLGAKNPHDSMTPEDSRYVVLAHVTDGLELARKYALPKAVRDFIPMHQGTTLMAYFYSKAIQRDGNQEYVMIMNASGQSTRVNVTSGQTTDGLTIVTGDLEEGQTIDLNVSSTVLPRGPGGNFGG